LEQLKIENTALKSLGENLQMVKTTSYEEKKNNEIKELEQ
jgi:hypothetical protein